MKTSAFSFPAMPVLPQRSPIQPQPRFGDKIVGWKDGVDLTVDRHNRLTRIEFVRSGQYSDEQQQAITQEAATAYPGPNPDDAVPAPQAPTLFQQIKALLKP
jgi:hypothetical protein